MTGDFLDGLIQGHKQEFADSLGDINKYLQYKEVVDELLSLDENERAERQRGLSKSNVQVLIDISRLSRAQLSNLKVRLESSLNTSSKN